MPGRTTRFRSRAFGCAIACGLLAQLARPVAAASLSPDDLRILTRALAFLQPRPQAGGIVAIVHAGRESDSYRDAEAIAAAIGPSLAVNGITLTPELVDAEHLSGIGFSLVIVAAGANADAVPRAMRGRHALCVTADQAAVQQGVCALAIHSTGKVEILLNSSAAQAADISFATAFRMMVTEL
jgi:hypothetical protein